MAGLEAVLRVTAQDDTGKALAAIKEKILGIEKTVGGMTKFTDAIAKTTKATDPWASSLLNAQKALGGQRNEIAGVISMMDRIVGPTERAASAQRALARSVETATSAISRQASTARSAERTSGGVGGHGGGGRAGGGHGGLVGMLPFAGPAIERGAERLVEAGASVQEEIARLKAAGATDADIDRAQGDWRRVSQNYAGVKETDYLAGYQSARVVAPNEAFEMAERGAKYKLALRNSGLPSTEFDVENVMKMMDELGLKDGGQRDDFINQTLKTQQTFGDQIKTETMLSAIRNAKQSMYDWSPDFRNKYFPTLLQASGQQGGTEIMTAFNNWVGGHMTHAELKAMAAAGFVDPKNLMYNKTGDIKGIKPGSHMYKADLFKSDIADWSWDFHDTFMKRKGSTEGKFDDLVATLPRNMAALISFWVHNEDRVKRDAATREGAVGSLASGNDYLAKNPGAGLEALTDSLSAFLGVVSQPAMGLAGKSLAAFAEGWQKLAATYDLLAKQHPDAATVLGVGGGAGAGAAGGWLSWKMFSGIGNFLGFGGGAAEGGAAGAAAGAVGGGLFGAIAKRLGILGAVIGATEFLDPKGNFGGLTSGVDKWVKDHLGFDPSNVPLPSFGGGVRPPSYYSPRIMTREQLFAHENELHPLIRGQRDMEMARAGALSHLADGGHAPAPAAQHVDVQGQATINGTIRVEAGSELLRIVNQAVSISQQIALNPTAGRHSGRMDSDASPLGRGGIGSR